jgi:hypothetical protein
MRHKIDSLRVHIQQNTAHTLMKKPAKKKKTPNTHTYMCQHAYMHVSTKRAHYSHFAESQKAQKAKEAPQIHALHTRQHDVGAEHRHDGEHQVPSQPPLVHNRIHQSPFRCACIQTSCIMIQRVKSAFLSSVCFLFILKNFLEVFYKKSNVCGHEADLLV